MSEPTWREADLTVSQAEVVRLLVAGRKPKQIAADLDLKESTVRDHIQNARERTMTGSIVALVLWAVRNGVQP